MGQFLECVDRGNLHVFIDAAGTHVQGPAEDEREPQYVVDLVRVIGSACRHDQIAAHRPCHLGPDLRHRIRQREHDRLFRHRGHHLGTHQVGTGHTDENVGAVHRVCECACFGLDRDTELVGVEVLAAEMDDAIAIDDQEVVPMRTHGDQQSHRRYAGGTGTEHHDARLVQLLTLQLQRIEQRSGDDDRGTMLVIVKHRDVELIDQRLLDLETMRRRDVFEVDAAKGRGDAHDGLDEFLWALGIHLDIEHIDAGKVLEQHTLALHHRLARQCTHITQPQDRAAVGDNRHQVALGRVLVRIQRIGGDAPDWFGDARRVGEGEIALGAGRLGHLYADLSRARIRVIIECGLVDLEIGVLVILICLTH